MNFQNYTATHKTWDHTSPVQPNVEVSEGDRPAEAFKPASYLACERYDKWYENWFVIQAGKVVALDSNGYVVNAGLKAQAAAYKTAFETNSNTETITGCKAVARAVSGLTLYTTNDVSMGIKNFAGNAAAAGEPVVESFFTIHGGTQNLSGATGGTAFGDSDYLDYANVISAPIGIAAFNVWVWAGGDGFNPTQYNFHNYNLQHQITVLCDYYIELPVVLDSNYAAAVLPGIAAAIYTSGAPFTPGCFVKVGMDGNMHLADVAGSDVWYEVVGQVLAVDTAWPKDYMDRVRTAFPNLGTTPKYNQAPGSATSGAPDNINLSGGTMAEGTVRINLILK
jgi:hypothetical protein